MTTPSEPQLTAKIPGYILRHVEVLKDGIKDRNRQQTLCTAAKALRDLSRDSPDNIIRQIAAAGAIPVLADILRNSNSSQILLQAATATLRNLAYEASLTQQVASHSAAPLGVLLRRSGVKACVLEQATGALRAISVKNLDSATALLSSGAINAMLQLIAAQESSEGNILNCIGVIFDLSAVPTISPALLDADVIPQLLQLLCHPSKQVQDAAALVLKKLAICSKSALEQLSTSGPVQTLISLMQRGDCTPSTLRSLVAILYVLLMGAPVNQDFFVAAAMSTDNRALLWVEGMQTLETMLMEQQGKIMQHIGEQFVAAGGVNALVAVLQAQGVPDCGLTAAINIITLLLDNRLLNPQSAPPTIPILIKLLEHKAGCSDHALLLVLQTLLIRLVTDSPSRSAAAAACGGIPVVMGMLNSNQPPGTLEKAVDLVRALASAHSDMKVRFQQAGALPVLQNLLAHGDLRVVSRAISAFNAISAHPEHQTPAGEAIYVLLTLVRDKATHPVQGKAAWALAQLCCGHEANARRLAAAGGVPVLIHALNTQDTSSGMAATFVVAVTEILRSMAGINSTSSAVTAALHHATFLPVLSISGPTERWQTIAIMKLFNVLLLVASGPRSIIACGGVEYLTAVLSKHAENNAIVEPMINFLARLMHTNPPQAAAALADRGVPASETLRAVLSKVATRHDGSTTLPASTMGNLWWLLKVLQGQSSDADKKRTLRQSLSVVWRGMRVPRPVHHDSPGAPIQTPSVLATRRHCPLQNAEGLLSQLASASHKTPAPQSPSTAVMQPAAITNRFDDFEFEYQPVGNHYLKLPTWAMALPLGVNAENHHLHMDSDAAAGTINHAAAAIGEPATAGPVTFAAPPPTSSASNPLEDSKALDKSMQAPLAATRVRLQKQKGAKNKVGPGEAVQHHSLKPPACVSDQIPGLAPQAVDHEAVPATADALPVVRAAESTGHTASRADRHVQGGSDAVRVQVNGCQVAASESVQINEPTSDVGGEEDTFTDYGGGRNMFAVLAISSTEGQAGNDHRSVTTMRCVNRRGMPAAAAKDSGVASAHAADTADNEQWTVAPGNRRLKPARRPALCSPVLGGIKKLYVAAAGPSSPGRTKLVTCQHPTAEFAAGPAVTAGGQSSRARGVADGRLEQSAQGPHKVPQQLAAAAGLALGATAVPTAAGLVAAADSPNGPLQNPAAEGLWTIAGMLCAVDTFIPASPVRNQLKLGITTFHPWRQQQPRLILPWLKLQLENLVKRGMQDLPGSQEVLQGILDLQESVDKALREGPPTDTVGQQQTCSLASAAVIAAGGGRTAQQAACATKTATPATEASEGVPKRGTKQSALQPLAASMAAGAAAFACTTHTTAERAAADINTISRAQRRGRKGKAQVPAAATHTNAIDGLSGGATTADPNRTANLGASADCIIAASNGSPAGPSVPQAWAGDAAAANLGQQQSPANKELLADHLSETEHPADRICCVVCMDAVRRVLLQPCCHFVLCEECALDFAPIKGGCNTAKRPECPVCRTAVEQQIVIYMT